MGQPIQIIKMDRSIINYFHMMMDLDNESPEYREIAIAEFTCELTKSLNCGPALKEIVWVESIESRKTTNL
jgi:hypothetical protein